MLERIKNLVVGRPEGFRRRMFSILFSESEDTSPNASFASPMGRTDDVGSSVYTTSGTEPPKGVTPPEGYEVVLHKEALKDQEMVEVIIAGTAIAIANANGELYAFSNSCTHDVDPGSPLTEGTLVIEEGKVWVRSPYHGWEYDLKTGECITSPGLDLECYSIHLEGDAICVKI